MTETLTYGDVLDPDLLDLMGDKKKDVMAIPLTPGEFSTDIYKITNCLGIKIKEWPQPTALHYDDNQPIIYVNAYEKEDIQRAQVSVEMGKHLVGQTLGFPHSSTNKTKDVNL